MIAYKDLKKEEISVDLFAGFIRRQEVVDCWRKEQGRWVVKTDPFVDDWSEEEYQFLVECLKHTVDGGGLVCGAFSEGILKGFVSVEAEIFGGEQGYMDLTSIHVSADMRGSGIGKVLFGRAKEWAREKGGRKLYISAHSAVETQAFYKAMGCVEAQVYDQRHVEAESYDCQLECSLEEG